MNAYAGSNEPWMPSGNGRNESPNSPATSMPGTDPAERTNPKSESERTGRLTPQVSATRSESSNGCQGTGTVREVEPTSSAITRMISENGVEVPWATPMTAEGTPPAVANVCRDETTSSTCTVKRLAPRNTGITGSRASRDKVSAIPPGAPPATLPYTSP